MNILITGGAGFIGSHLADLLLENGHQVFVIDNLSTGSMSNIKHICSNPNFHFARTSIMNEAVIDRIMSQCDVVVHLAAAVGVKLIIDHPVNTIETNVMGSEVVLRTALRYGCRVLISSTSEVYGKGFSFPFHESDDVLLGPTDKSRWAYAASKMIDEFLGLAYYQEYGLPVVPFRLFNTIGPRQIGQYGMVIPRLMSQALMGDPLTVYGDGNQSRCFCDVHDVIRAIVGLMYHPDAPGKLFNIGSSDEISIFNLARKIKDVTNSESEIVLIPYTEAYPGGFEDMERRNPDTTRIRALLGWEPEIPFHVTLVRVCDWIKNSPKEW
jgi:UDP-glucose 4-epimerase